MNITNPPLPTSDIRGQNIDPSEVEHYKKLADTWWDPTGPFWPLHRLNTLRVHFLKQRLCREFGRDAEASKPLKGLTILDIGCGGGILSESMAVLGATVHGIDVVQRNIAVADAHSAARGLEVEYETVNINQLKSRARIYDVVLNMEVIEHVPDYSQFLRDTVCLLAPGGIMAVATINRNLISWLFAIVGAEYVLGWLPMGTHRWQKFVKPDEVIHILREETLEIRESSGVSVNPFNRKFKLSDQMWVNYMLLARKPA